MTPSERADRAKELLENPVLKACFSEMRESFVRKLETTPVNDVEIQHELALSLQILKSLRSQIEKMAQGDPVDKYRVKQDTFMDRIKQRLTP